MRLRWLGLWTLALAGSMALAQPTPAPAAAPAPVLAKDLRESVHEIDVSVQDLYGRREQRRIPLTVFRPSGTGPFPVLVLNHGRAGTAAERAQPPRIRFEQQARYFAGKGLAVIVPTRVGYGQTQIDSFDPESNGGCGQAQIGPMSQAASEQVLAAIEWARGQPDLDAQRWWVAGISVGGLTSVATVMRAPAGLQGGINFSGGTGGSPKERPGQPCGVVQVAQYWQAHAAKARVPMLWLYWENDLYWGAEHPRRWHQAYTAGGGQAEWAQLGPISGDGHLGFARDMDRWIPLVDAFLARAGLTQSALPPVPPPSGFASLDDVERLPGVGPSGRDLYRRFLSSAKPRAFAIGPSGQSGFATGDWAVGKALGFCQARTGVRCQLYAVDDQVVWRAP